MAATLIPTQSELDTFKTVDDISEWADLPHRAEDSAEASTSPRGMFLKALGTMPSTKPRTTADISEETFIKVIDEWRIQDQRPSTILTASAGLVGVVARAMFGVVSDAEVKNTECEHTL